MVRCDFESMMEGLERVFSSGAHGVYARSLHPGYDFGLAAALAIGLACVALWFSSATKLRE